MSVWHAPSRGRAHLAAHPISAQELIIFAGAVVLAAMIGIAASGLLPI
jgi:hypothetical protein